MLRKIMLLGVTCLTLAGCSLVTVVDANHSQHGGMTTNNSSYTADELMIAQMMIPHHEQAVLLSEWAKTRAFDPQVRSLAEQIRKAQAPEITQMTSWLEKANQALNHHSMHMTMAGMLSDEELSKIKSLSGKAFDQAFLSAMIEHHESAIDMATDYLDKTSSEVKQLLESIIESQKTEIDQMKMLLESAN